MFNNHGDIDEISLERGIPDPILDKVLSCKPLSTFIPSEYGGRGAKTHEALSMLEASSYESLSLSLMMGINGALFLQPVANYGKEEIKRPIFRRFIEENTMGGLMITEPDYGSDALRMETSYRQKKNDGYEISGTKHWAGLTGQADYWLITARKEGKNGNLGRDIAFFVHDSRNGGIEVEEYFKNLGLYMLPYGRNKINIRVPKEYKLQPKSIGIKMMLDVLHRSRLQFPGMGMGFLRRMLDEAYEHCKNRSVGGQNLFNYDQVKKRLTRLQSSFTICSAMCAYTSEHVPLDRDVSDQDVSANSIKTMTTDLMQEAAQSLLQLMGAKGYRLDHIAGRSLIDSRPFQIFEGSNDILYQQISESIVKLMRKLKFSNLYEFMKEYDLTSRASDYFKELLDFEIDPQMAQHKFVELGRVCSRIISLEFTLRLGDKGFNDKLISNTITTLKSDVHNLMATFNFREHYSVVEEYNEDSSWLKAVPRVSPQQKLEEIL
ncbi:MAG: acyl-CoA dehydrogenase family protein [Balneolaceae bacterium]